MIKTLFDYRLLYLLATIIIVYEIAIGWGNDHPSFAFSNLLSDYGHFFLIGLIAAIIANSTGAGGGIVFFPAFVSLGLSTQEALATSIAIQCFGMTAGTLGWLRVQRRELNGYAPQWKSFSQIIILSLPASLLGLLCAQWLFPYPQFSVHILFSVFSLIVGVAILKNRNSTSSHGRWQPLAPLEKGIIIVTSLIGGVITAWLSIGIGEMLAVCLIFLGFRTNLAVATAVTLSALTVLAGVPYHALVGKGIQYEVLLFAAPAAAIGGTMASWLAVKMGAVRLKKYMAGWIILSALLYLIAQA